MLLKDLQDSLEEGSDFGVQPATLERADSNRKQKFELIEDTDGCGEQYRSGNSLYMLTKLAFENDLIYCRAIDAEGHGKKSIDGLSGGDKAYLEKILRGLVEYQPEALEENKKQVLFVDVKDGKKQDFAITARDILSCPGRRHGIEKVPSIKPRTEQEQNDKAILSRGYMARDDNEVKYKGMKLEGKGFSKKRRSGMRSSYDYIMAKRLGLGKFAYRRISCFCAPCRDHLDQPFDERFSGSA